MITSTKNNKTLSAMNNNTNQTFAMWTRKIEAGFYEIEFCPAGSDVFTAFTLIRHDQDDESSTHWRLSSIGGWFTEPFATKNDAIDFIKTRITRGGRFEHLFQN